MFDGYFPNQFGPGRSAVICQHGAVATIQPLAVQGGLRMLRVRIRGVIGGQSAIETAENLLDFRLKLKYNIRTNMRLRLKNKGLNRSM